MLSNAVACHSSHPDVTGSQTPHQMCHSHQVLAFPCDSFHQESGTDQAVKDFARVRSIASCVKWMLSLCSLCGCMCS